MMKSFTGKIFQVTLVAAMATIVSACGGGGDVAGDTEDFFTVPKESELKVTEDARGGCSFARGEEMRVTIVGGRPPYRIQNPYPNSLRIDRTEATGKDPVFKVTSLGGCVDPAPILVLDYHSRSAIFEYKVTAEEQSD